jgi:hypothetical protein
MTGRRRLLPSAAAVLAAIAARPAAAEATLDDTLLVSPPGGYRPPGPGRSRRDGHLRGAEGQEGKVKVTCTVNQTGASRKSSPASWRIARGKRTVAHGAKTIRQGRLALDLAHLVGVRRGRYVLTVKIGATVVRQAIRVR